MGPTRRVYAEHYGYDGWKTDLDPAGNPAGLVGNENFDVWADLDSGNALVTRRLFGNSVDELVARESISGTVAWYDTDRLGSVRFLTSGSGAVQATITYDGFGKTTSNSNPSFTDRYGYTGRELDSVAGGLVHLRDRDLSLDLGRFLSRDPLGFGAGDANLTRYVGNAPTNFTDPSGWLSTRDLVQAGPDLVDQEQRVPVSDSTDSPVILPGVWSGPALVNPNPPDWSGLLPGSSSEPPLDLGGLDLSGLGLDLEPRLPNDLLTPLPDLIWSGPYWVDPNPPDWSSLLPGGEPGAGPGSPVPISVPNLDDWGSLRPNSPLRNGNPLPDLIWAGPYWLDPNPADLSGVLAGLPPPPGAEPPPRLIRVQEPTSPPAAQPPTGPERQAIIDDLVHQRDQLGQAINRATPGSDEWRALHDQYDAVIAQLQTIAPEGGHGRTLYNPPPDQIATGWWDRHVWLPLGREYNDNTAFHNTVDVLGAIGSATVNYVTHPWELLDDFIVQPVKRTGQFLWDIPNALLDPEYQPSNPHFAAYLRGELRWSAAVFHLTNDAVAAAGTTQLAGMAVRGGARLLARGANPRAPVAPAGPRAPQLEAPAAPRPPAAVERPAIRESLEVIQTSCFVAGTPLLTPTGSKAIEQFRPGDVLLSRSEYDPESAVEAKVVEEVFTRVSPILELHVGGRMIRTTAEHPFYVRGRGWLCAKELSVGTELVSHDGQRVFVAEVRDAGEVATVYNLRIADFHTYFVGSREWGFSVWAHNAQYEIIRLPNGDHALVQRGMTRPLEPVPRHRVQGRTVDDVLALADRYGIDRANIAPTMAEGNPILARVPANERARLVMQVKPSARELERNYHRYTNPGHHDPSRSPGTTSRYKPNKSVLPSNHVELFSTSVPITDGSGTVIRWAVEQTRNGRVYHRFEPHQPGVYHWSGSTNGITASGTPRRLPMNLVPIRAIEMLMGG